MYNNPIFETVHVKCITTKYKTNLTHANVLSYIYLQKVSYTMYEAHYLRHEATGSLVT